jgi:hypothetical protein
MRDATALCFAIRMLHQRSYWSLDGEQITAEGAGDEKVPGREQELRDLLREAERLADPRSESLKDLLASTAELIRSFDKGLVYGRVWGGFVPPTEAGTGKPCVALKSKFVGGQLAAIALFKVSADGGPLDVRIYDSDQRLTQHSRGNCVAFEWFPTRDTDYRIEIRNPHTAAVPVRACMN